MACLIYPDLLCVLAPPSSLSPPGLAFISDTTGYSGGAANGVGPQIFKTTNGACLVPLVPIACLSAAAALCVPGGCGADMFAFVCYYWCSCAGVTRSRRGGVVPCPMFSCVCVSALQAV